MKRQNIVSALLITAIMTANIFAGKCCTNKQKELPKKPTVIQTLKQKISNIIHRSVPNEVQPEQCPEGCICTNEECTKCDCSSIENEPCQDVNQIESTRTKEVGVEDITTENMIDDTKIVDNIVCSEDNNKNEMTETPIDGNSEKNGSTIEQTMDIKA